MPGQQQGGQVVKTSMWRRREGGGGGTVLLLLSWEVKPEGGRVTCFAGGHGGIPVSSPGRSRQWSDGCKRRQWFVSVSARLLEGIGVQIRSCSRCNAVAGGDGWNALMRAAHEAGEGAVGRTRWWLEDRIEEGAG